MLSLSTIKKTLLVSLILPCVLGLTACNNDNSDNSDTSSQGKKPVMDCAPTK